MLKSAKSDNIRNLFENIKIIQGIQQLKNILKLITNTHFRDSHNPTIRNSKPGIYAECLDPRCCICSLGYIKECSSFMIANNILWEIKSHINCNSKNVIYFLKCNMCNGNVSKMGKTKSIFRKCINNHISDCRKGNTTDIFDLHVHECDIVNKCLNEPYFEIRAFMTLANLINKKRMKEHSIK